MQETTFCSKCQQYKPTSEFRSESGSTTYYRCNDCRRAHAREWMQNKRALPHAKVWSIIIRAMGSSCVRCGYCEFAKIMMFYPVRDTSGKTIANTVNGVVYSYGQKSWDELTSLVNDHILLCPSCGKALQDGLWSLDDIPNLRIGFKEIPSLPPSEHD